MLNYVVCQIKGKQYKIMPDQPFLVDWLGEDKKDIEAELLLKATDGKLEIGTPFLKEKLALKNLGTVLSEKVRVAKFHAKANYRRVTGIRPRHTQLVYAVKK